MALIPQTRMDHDCVLPRGLRAHGQRRADVQKTSADKKQILKSPVTPAKVGHTKKSLYPFQRPGRIGVIKLTVDIQVGNIPSSIFLQTQTIRKKK